MSFPLSQETLTQLEHVIEYLDPLIHHSDQTRAQAIDLLLPYLLLEPLESNHTKLTSLPLLKYLFLHINSSSKCLCINAAQSLLSLSGSLAGRKQILKRSNSVGFLMETLEDFLPQEDSTEFLSIIIKILSNLTLEKEGQTALLNEGEETEGIHLLKLLKLFSIVTKEKLTLDDKGEPMDAFKYIANIMTNISQHEIGRKYLLDERRNIFSELVSQMTSSSKVRKLGVLRTLRNCCFQLKKHSYLLQLDNQFIPILLSFIMGNDLIDCKEFDDLPEQVKRYWSDVKERDDDPHVRRLVLETIEVLVRNAETRTFLKDINVYILFREYEKWEKDEHTYDLLDEVVQWFIMDDPVHLKDEQEQT